MDKPKIPLAVVVAVLVVGLGITAYALWQLGDEILFAFRSTKAQGIVQPAGKGNESGSTPVRVFGEGRSVEYHAGPAWTRVKPGDKVALLVIPEQPDSARIDSFAERYLLPLLLLIVGSAALAFCGWDYRKRRRYWLDVRDRDALTPALWKRW